MIKEPRRVYWYKLQTTNVKKHLRDQLTYIILAELGLLITALIVSQRPQGWMFPQQELVSNVAFSIICLLGIIVGIAPNWCSFSSGSERRGNDGVAGHHPDCGRFPGHTVRLGDRVFCAGCSGLVLGAVLALLGLISGVYPLGYEAGFWIGVFFVGLGLAQHLIDLGSGWVHLLLNTLLVVGDWLMFEAIQSINLGFLVSAYFLTVTVFWIFARIRASQWVHVGVCSDCSEPCMLRFE